MRGVIPRLQPSHRHPLLVDVGGVEPGVQRLDRPGSEIDGLILIGTGCFRAAEMDGERGRGRAVVDLDCGLDRELLLAQPGNSAAPAAAEAKATIKMPDP